MSEISIILGEIMRIIPLESYFSNLGMNQEISVPKDVSSLRFMPIVH